MAETELVWYDRVIIVSQAQSQDFSSSINSQCDIVVWTGVNILTSIVNKIAKLKSWFGYNYNPIISD
jgi:hypothetical protein